MHKTIIIADNLVNDYCGLRDRYLQNNVHIGPLIAERLFGRPNEDMAGPISLFLQHMTEEHNVHVLFIRDYYDPDDTSSAEHLERLGNHCIKGSTGEEFVTPIRDLVGHNNFIDHKGLSFPYEGLQKAILRIAGLDLSAEVSGVKTSEDIRFLLIGFHTERRIFTIGNVLRNLFGFRYVAVFSHFTASANKDAHFASLQYQFPDNLIMVLNCASALAEYLGLNLSYLEKFHLKAVQIRPAKMKSRLNPFQVQIIETLCMDWTEARLKLIGDGYSDSALFLAHGKQGNSKTEPMVIKIDEHTPIRLEIKGYHLVKDFLGKHVPTLTLPVSSGAYSGVGMELAAMEGPPMTLQDQLEKADSDKKLFRFLDMLDRVLLLLNDRLYSNTKIERNIAPYRHYQLHLEQHSKWLKTNLKNIQRHHTDQIVISSEAILNLFDALRKNNDVLLGELCIAHGDLNLANILSDRKENLWAIDWTHTGMHPISIDFAKLENDVKFVLSKDLTDRDLPRLRLLEEYLLNNRIPAPTDQLPDGLAFIDSDLRFKKIYLPVREFRLAYDRLQSDQEWLVYKVALLRYTLHTLSFDESLGQGECKPPQLWYALLSVEILVNLLVGDDFHLKIRSEKPEQYPERYRIAIDQADWSIEAREYAPPYFVADSVINEDRTVNLFGHADPENAWIHPRIIEWGGPYVTNDDGKPLNPGGRTGIEGRGSLWLWGSNPMIFLCPIFYNRKVGQLECLINTNENESDVISIHLRRGETFEDALGRAEEKMNMNVDDEYSKLLYEGYFYDNRQTDNAWIDARAFLIFINDDTAVVRGQDNGFQWKPLNHHLINGLHSSYANLLRSAISHLYDEEIHREEFMLEILEKTG